MVGSTGVCGLTLGGGIGHLTARYGLTCDNLVAAEVVTPGGEVVRASGGENSDLLWALRGGGGDFGVATRMEFRLHRLEHVVGGYLEYRGDGVKPQSAWTDARLDREQRAWAREAPRRSSRGRSAAATSTTSGGRTDRRVRLRAGAFERLQSLKRRYDPDNALQPQPEHPAAR